MSEQKGTPMAYRWAAFTHWSNLAFLTAVGMGGALVDPAWWYVLVPTQALLFWLAPDVPPLRKAVDAQSAQKQRDAERTYYLDQLWGLRPLPAPSLGARMKRMIVSADVPEPDDRLPRKGENARYFEMRDILSKLRAMLPIAEGRVTPADLERLDKTIIGYLRVLFACRPLQRAVAESDEEQLAAQLAEIEQRIANADAALRPVLQERKRLVESQLERAPRLRATLELLRTRADAIPQQLRNLHSQVLTDPGSEVHAMLNDMIERNDMLADPLADLAADEAVRELLEQPEPAKPRPAGVRAAGRIATRR
jgi:hypothetical protein